MADIFAYTDPDGDGLVFDLINRSDDHHILVYLADRFGGVVLNPKAVTELRAALRPHDPNAEEELATEYINGYADAALERVDTLDQARVAALEKAAEIASGLRSSGALTGAGAVSHETVLAYAFFLLDLLPKLAAQK